MARGLGTLVIDLIMKMGGFETDTNRARRLTEKMVKGIEGDLNKMAKAAIANAAVLGTAITAGLAKAIARAGEFDDMAQKVGASTEELSALGFAAEREGVKLDQLTTSLGKLTKTLSAAAAGSKEQETLLKALGISATTADGQLRGTTSVLLDIAEVFEKLPDGATKSDIAMKLFGKSGMSLIPLLNQGADGIEELTKQAERLGLVVSTDTAKAADDFGNNLFVLQQSMVGLANQVAAELLPNLVTLSSQMIDNGEKIDGVNRSAQSLATVIKTVAAGILTIGAGAEAVGVKVGMLVDRLGILKDYAKVGFNAVNGGGAGLKDSLNEATSGGRLGFLDRWKATSTAGADSMDDIVQRLTDKYEALFSTVAPGAKDAANALDEQGKSTGEVDKKTQELLDRYKEYLKGLKDNSAAQKAAEEAAKKRAETEARLLARAQETTKAQKEFKTALEGMRAELAGPVAVAQANYQKQIEELQEAFFEGIATAADATEAQKMYADEVTRVGAAYEKQLLSPLRETIKANQDEIRYLTAGKGAREVVRRQLEKEEIVRRATEGMTKKQIEAYKDEIETLGDVIDQRQRATAIDDAKEGISSSFSSILDETISGIRSGEGAWQSFARAGSNALGSLTSDFIKLQKEGGDFSDSMEQLGMELLPKVGEMVGFIAGGSGQYAALGSAIGGAIGAAIGAYYGGAGGAQVGMAIGSAIGGWAGGQFDEDPQVRVSSQRYNNTEASRETPLGSINVRTESITEPSSRMIADQLQDFDRQLAAFLPPEHIARARAALASFHDVANGSGAAVLEIMKDRFNVVLGTFGTDIEQFVRTLSNDLQTQVQALSDIVMLDRWAEEGKLVTGTMTQTLGLIQQFRGANETVGETYMKLSAATLTLKEAFGLGDIAIMRSTDAFAALAGTIMEEVGSLEAFTQMFEAAMDLLYTETERASMKLSMAEDDARNELDDIGINYDDLDLTNLEDFKAKFNQVLASGNEELIRQWLEAAAALGIVIDRQEEYNSTLQDGAEAIPVRSDKGMAELMDQVNETVQDWGLSDFEREMAQVQRRTDEWLASARAMGATEEELARIRDVGAHHAQQLILDRQNELNDFMENLGWEDMIAGMSEYDAEVARINKRTEDLIAQAIALGATEEQLAQIRQYGANSIDRLRQAEEARAESANVISAGQQELYRRERLQEILEEVANAIGKGVASLMDQALAIREKYKVLYREAVNLHASDSELAFIRRGAEVELQRLIDAERERIEQLRAERNVLMDWLDAQSLGQLSTLNPFERVQEASRQLDELIAKFTSGSIQASEVTPALDAYLQELATYYGVGSPEYQRLERELRDRVTDLAINYDDTNAELADAIERLNELLEAMANGTWLGYGTPWVPSGEPTTGSYTASAQAAMFSDPNAKMMGAGQAEKTAARIVEDALAKFKDEIVEAVESGSQDVVSAIRSKSSTRGAFG